MTIAYIGLGGNVGDRAGTLMVALQKLAAHPAIRVRRISQFYRTEPVGGPEEQPFYLNAAAEVETDLRADELLAAMQTVEVDLGRDRSREVRWGPRTCDLDLLLFGDEVIETASLTVPHPRITERAFVLDPLAEIAAGVIHPTAGKTIAELRAELYTEENSERSAR